MVEALRISRIGCWQYDNRTGDMIWSLEMFTLMGFEPSASAPTYDEMLSHVYPRDARVHWAALQRALRDGKPHDFDIRLDPRFTTVQWLHVIIQPELDEAGRVVRLFGVAIDISERKAAEKQTEEYAVLLEQKMAELKLANERLEALATTDGLTGVTNHRAFQERLAAEFRRTRRSHAPLSLILLDVDYFKQFNDAFGHPAGDGVLKKIASILLDCIRSTDLVARYGGEEFVILLPGADMSEAVTIAERCRSAIMEWEWERRRVTSSFGVASTSAAVTTAATLIAAADRALYTAKSAGRNRVSTA